MVKRIVAAMAVLYCRLRVVLLKCYCDDRSMLASLWLHPGPSGHAKQRQNAILKFSLVYMVSEET